ncbi:MAG: GNAT family N-acetyltransferase [Bacteroidetes bacterium]|nr:GNAT family N-acetyltransferase [Bacteroidota bacterium]
MIIRQATGSDADAIAALLSKSFLEDTAIIRVSIENNPRYSLSDMYVIEDKSVSAGIAGCLRITPFEVCSRGVKMPMAGIAAVAVQPEARRRGIAEALMENALLKMYEMNYPVSMLFPFKHYFYKKFGYAYAGNMVQYEFSPNNIVTFEDRSHVRAFGKSDKNKLKSVLQQETQVHGSFTPMRGDSFWDLVVLPKLKDAYVYDDGEVKGYVVFELYKDTGLSAGSTGEPVINIKEFVGLDAPAHRGLWGFIGALGEQVSRIKFLAPADYPLHLFLKEPRESDYHRLFFEYKSFAKLASGFMLRVINVPDALRKLRHGVESPADFVLKVNDGNLPQNSRNFNLHVHSGETAVDETKQTAQFETDIEIFSQIYSGFLKPGDALKYGFASGEPAVASKLNELFEAPAPFIYQYDIF